MGHLATRFDVVDAPKQFDRVLLIYRFPGRRMEPTHAPGGSLYVTVIEGEISTRLGGAPGDTYPARSTFTASAGEYLELGNSAAGKSRTIATALLSKGAPLTVDHAGFSGDAHSRPRDGERVLDSVSHALRPTTVYHSSLAVEPPAGAFELVHLLLELDPSVREPKSLLVDGERAALEADFVNTSR